MALWLRILIGGGIGLLGGALLGYLGKCTSGVCPLTANPYRGALIGALMGVAVALAIGPAGCRQAERQTGGAAKHVSTEEGFEARVLKADKPVLVDFYLIGCAPCIALAPTIERLAEEYEGRAYVFRVNQADLSDRVTQYKIEGFPTVLLFSDGKVIGRWEGFSKAGDFESKYRAALDAAIQGKQGS